MSGVGVPVPAEHTLAVPRLRDQLVAAGDGEFEEELEVVVFDVGVEVDSAIVFGGGGVILHWSI